jgi:hypothetical protein
MQHKRYARLSPVRSYSFLAISWLGFALSNPRAKNLLPFLLPQTRREHYTNFQITPADSTHLLRQTIPGRLRVRSILLCGLCALRGESSANVR